PTPPAQTPAQGPCCSPPSPEIDHVIQPSTRTPGSVRPGPSSSFAPPSVLLGPALGRDRNGQPAGRTGDDLEARRLLLSRQHLQRFQLKLQIHIAHPLP